MSRSLFFPSVFSDGVHICFLEHLGFSEFFPNFQEKIATDYLLPSSCSASNWSLALPFLLPQTEFSSLNEVSSLSPL